MPFNQRSVKGNVLKFSSMCFMSCFACGFVADLDLTKRNMVVCSPSSTLPMAFGRVVKGSIA